MKLKSILMALVLTAVMTSCCENCSKKELFNGKDLTGWV